VSTTPSRFNRSRDENRPALAGTVLAKRRKPIGRWTSQTAQSRVSDISLPLIQRRRVRLKKDGKSADTCWTYGQRVRSFGTYLIPRYLLATILEGFTVPEPSVIGRKNWLHKHEVTNIIEAAGDDLELKFALYCGFDAGLRVGENRRGTAMASPKFSGNITREDYC
jgi:hypothetical protein